MLIKIFFVIQRLVIPYLNPSLFYTLPIFKPKCAKFSSTLDAPNTEVKSSPPSIPLSSLHPPPPLSTHRTCAVTAAVHAAPAMPQPKSAISTPLPWKLIIRSIKGYSHSFRITCDMCAATCVHAHTHARMHTHKSADSLSFGSRKFVIRSVIAQCLTSRLDLQVSSRVV